MAAYQYHLIPSKNTLLAQCPIGTIRLPIIAGLG